MDWFLEPSDRVAAQALRREFGEYLRRHGAPDSDFAAAELAFAEVVANVERHAGGPAWVQLDWAGEHPVLTVHDLGPGFALPTAHPDELATSGRGLFIVSHLSRELTVASKRAGGTRVSVVLPVRRPSEASHDPPRISPTSTSA